MSKSNSNKLDQSGIALTPPKGLTIKDVNFTKAIGSIFKFVIGAGTYNPTAMATATVEFGNLADYTDGEKAWHLVSNSLLMALEQVVQDGGMLTLQNTNVVEKLNTIIETFCQQLLELNCHLSQEFLTKPHKLLEDSDFENIVNPALTKLGHSDTNAKILYQRLVHYFPFALTKESQNNKTDYSSLFSLIKSEFAVAEKTALKKQQYKQFLIRQAYESVFNDTVGLKQIYVPLNAYYEREIVVTLKDSNKTEIKKSVTRLHEKLNEWVLSDNTDHHIKIIAGGPGAGKSSFSKIWAAEIVNKLNYPVIFIPLQRFQINDNLTSALTNFFAEQPDWSSLSNVLPNESNLLIIFDGLDEYSMTGQQSDKAANEFIDELTRSLQQKNNSGGNVKAIITGRDLSIDNNKSKWRYRSQILHLLPYFFTLPENNEYDDPDNLIATDLRQVWWTQYTKVKNVISPKLPKVFSQEKLLEVSAEPLLNYLLTLSYLAKRIIFDDNTTLAAIYEDLILGVFNRDYCASKQHKTTEEMADSKQFILILEEVALAISYNGGHLATEKTIQEHIQNVGFSDLFAKLQQKTKSGVTRLLMAFYFREGEYQDGHNTFVWTHKSFGEYLVARRLIALLKEISEKLYLAKTSPREGWHHEKALEEFVKTTAPMKINQNIRDFVNSILHQSINNKEMDTNNLQTYQLFLADCISARCSDHLRMKQYFPDRCYSTLCKLEYNSVICFFVLHSVISNITGNTSNLNLENKNSFRKLYIQMDSFGFSLEFRNSLNNLNLEQQSLILLDVQWAKFNNCQLELTDFAGCSLIHTQFINSNLKNSILDSIHTLNTDFTRCDLRNSSFKNAQLYHCNFQYSKLNGCEFRRVIDAGDNRGFETSEDFLLAKNLPEAWKKYQNKQDDNDYEDKEDDF